jgi:hypothetical protein
MPKIIRQRGARPRATSCRNPGRHYPGIPGRLRRNSHGGDDRPYHVYYLGDFDRAGRDAANSLEEKLKRFAEDGRLDVRFLPIAVNRSQIVQGRLPTLNARLRAAIRSSLSQDGWGENCQTARQNAGADQRRQPRRRLPEPAPPIRGPFSGLGPLFPVSGETAV